MSGTPTFFTTAYTYFDGKLILFLDTRYQNVVEAVKGPLTAALVIYIVLYAIMIMRGVVSEPFTDFLWRMARLCLIFVAATTVAYKNWITNPLFHAAPAAVTQAISGQDYTTMGAVFDKLESKAAKESKACRLKAASLPITQTPYALELYVLAFAVDLAAEVCATVGFAISMLAIVALAVVIALGPIMIALSLFQWGRGMFEGWLRQSFNYILLLSVITAMTELVSDLADTALAGTDLSTPENSAAVYILYYLLGALFFWQSPSIASGITGGASLGAGEMAAGLAGGAALVRLEAAKTLASGSKFAESSTSRLAQGTATLNRWRSRNTISRR